VIFTADHGDLLGAHGGMHQKWYNAYEETTHVPLIIASPLLGNVPRSISGLTSHADLTPTLLGLADVDVEQAAKQLAQSHTETRPLVGRDLADVVRGHAPVPRDPIFFMTYDDVSQGLSQIVGNRQWDSVTTPNQVETVIVEMDNAIWKYSEYSQCYKTPYFGLIKNENIIDKLPPQNVPKQCEMYDVSHDQIEATNLAWPEFQTTRSKEMQARLEALLEEQRKQKCLVPITNQGVAREGGEGSIVIEVPLDVDRCDDEVTTAPPPPA